MIPEPAHPQYRYLVVQFPAVVQSAIRAFLIALIISTLLAIDETAADPILAQQPTLKILRLSHNKNAALVAKEYLGDELEAWQITELNGRSTFKAGDIVALPLSPINPGAVYAEHYRSIPILCYHRFSPGSIAKHQLEVSANDFDRQMAYLADNNFQVIPLKKVSEILSGKTSIPPNAVVLTIDDGYRSVYDIAFPILKKYGLTATMFVYTDFIGGSAALSWQQLKDMQASGIFDIESHTKTHSSLSYDASKEDAPTHKARITRELDQAETAIKNHTGHPISLLAYPYGDSSLATLDHLKSSSNYVLAATVKRGANSAFADPLLLQRTMVYNTHTLSDFKNMIVRKQTR